jgi:hypothetical protein
VLLRRKTNNDLLASSLEYCAFWFAVEPLSFCFFLYLFSHQQATMSTTETLPVSTLSSKLSKTTLRGSADAPIDVDARPTPLVPTGYLSKFGIRELTPTIGSQIENGVQLSDLLDAEDSDEVFRELAIQSPSPLPRCRRRRRR